MSSESEITSPSPQGEVQSDQGGSQTAPTKGVPVVLSGPSGVGKTTIQRQLLSRYQDVVASISATTRPPRPHEVHGKDYLFLSESSFKEGLTQGLFIEHAEVHGYLYGTPRNALMESLHQGVDVLLVIDVQGGIQVRQQMPEALLIFLLPPSQEELEARIRQRGDVSGKEMELRLKNAEWELSFALQYDYCVINQNLEKAVNQVRAILVAEKCRPQRILKDFESPGFTPD